MYDFVRGPLVWVAFIVFIAGLIYQTFQFFRMTRRKERVFMPRGTEGSRGQSTESIGQWVVFLRKTILGHHPVMTVVTSLFHVCLILTPIFLLAHSILFYESWGVTPWSFSEVTTEVMTVIVLLCCAFFLLRRIFVRRVRAITTGYDYLILMIAAAPFVSGYLAYHQWVGYETILIAHILAGEVMLIVIPFTKLGHMLFFFLYRFFIGSEYSFGQGTRTW